MDFETSVYEDGSLIGCECSYQTHLNGEFESTKKLKFVLSNHGLGGGNTYHVTGNKKWNH